MKSAMPTFSLRPRLLSYFSVVVLAVFATAFASAQTENVIHKFGGPDDGALPQGGLIADSQGSIYGATSSGGIHCLQTGSGCGVIFKLRPPATVGAPWAEKVLYKFTGHDDGLTPEGGLLLNPSTGKFYGAAALGGANRSGVIYELDPGTQWTEKVIHTFSGGDGQNPNGYLNLVNGRLIGSTANGGVNRSGVVYALTPSGTPGGAWTEHVLHTFDSRVDGNTPGASGVIADSTGALYGTTTSGGGTGLNGTVWKLSPPAGSGPWTLTTLHAFPFGPDGSNPYALVLAGDGTLYGVAPGGGDPICVCGTVFRLTPPSSGTGSWTFTVLHTFTGGLDGSTPTNLVLDDSGTIYGVAGGGGFICGLGQSAGCGVVFTLTPPGSGGGSWTENVLYDFQGNTNGGKDGNLPAGRPLLLNGNVYGVTQFGGGHADSGTVFEVVP